MNEQNQPSLLFFGFFEKAEKPNNQNALYGHRQITIDCRPLDEQQTPKANGKNGNLN